MNRSVKRFLIIFLALLIYLTGVVPTVQQNQLVLGREVAVTGLPMLLSVNCLPEESCALQDDLQNTISQVFRLQHSARLRGISTVSHTCTQLLGGGVTNVIGPIWTLVLSVRDTTPGKTALISHIHRTRRKRL